MQPVSFPDEFVPVLHASPPGISVRLSLVKFVMDYHRDATRTQ